ncbi:MAG TPA: cytochrome c3 family protein [Isosphaeraceae bacterium]|nr:cytochrome c3 family protein [Isosphaeraceae bacterium]
MARQETGGPDPKHQRGAVSPRRAGMVIALGLAATAAAALWVAVTAGRTRPVTGRLRNVRLLTFDRPFPEGGRFASDPYIGSHVCAECHPGEAALHSRSGHALTLRPAARRALSRRLDGTSVADPELPDVRWSYRYADGRLSIARRTPNQVEECIAEYAFGSGHHATTFVSVIDPVVPAILEHRLSYYTRDGVLALTPGHETKPPPPGLTPHGGVPPPRDARACFGCHATQVSARGSPGIDEAMMIPNISCERCHGPGRAHVAAARRGAPESQLALPFGPDRWTAPDLLKFCGTCHRHPSGPRPEQIRPDDPNLARFQPIGLMQSACYRQSQGALSCVTCHDPHARASSRRAEYDAVCLECHGGPAGSGGSARSLARPGAVCPVSPRQRCVECHMPQVGVDAGRHILLSDHWIRIRREAQSTAESGTAVSNTHARVPHDP